MRSDKKSPLKSDKKTPPKIQKKGVVGYNKKSALLEDAITQMNAGKYGRASSALKELLALDPHNAEARRLFATLHLRLGSLMSARTAFESLAREALERQDYWLAESLLREYLVAGPRCVPFLDMLGHVYEEKGDAMAAVAEYGKAVEVLLEDPDPDNPNRASDLFAKIRELAPASPVAFRFAAMFDATTGLLIQQAVPPAADSITPSAEPAVSGDLPADLPSEPGSAPEVHSANLEVTPAEQPPSVAIEQSLEVAEPVLPDTAAPVETATAEGKKPQTEPPALADSISIPEGHLQTVFADSSESASAPSLSAALESTSEAIRSVEPVAPAQPVMPVEAGMPAEAVAPVESAMPIEAAAQPASVQLSESIADQTIEAPAEPIPSPIVPEVLSQPSSEPIAAAPSSPAPMPWDQVQEVAAELPAASAPEMKEEAPVEPPRPSLELISQPSPFPIATAPTVPAAMPWDHVQESPVLVSPPTDATSDRVEPIAPSAPSSAVLAGDQTIPPIASSAALSWDEILKAVEQFRTEASSQLAAPPVPAEEPTAGAPRSETMPNLPAPAEMESLGADHQIDMPPASLPEVVLDATPLSAPMPWEQVEHDTVAIPRLEREPEFGSMPVVPKPDTQDPTLILQPPLDQPDSPSTAQAGQAPDVTSDAPPAEPALRILSLDTPVAAPSPIEKTIHIPPVALEPAEEVPSAASPESKPVLAEAGPVLESVVEQPAAPIDAPALATAKIAVSEPAPTVIDKHEPVPAVAQPSAAVPSPVIEPPSEDTFTLAVEAPLAVSPAEPVVVEPEEVVPEPPALRLATEPAPEPVPLPKATPAPQPAVMAAPAFTLAQPGASEQLTRPAPTSPALPEAVPPPAPEAAAPPESVVVESPALVPQAAAELIEIAQSTEVLSPPLETAAVESPVEIVQEPTQTEVSRAVVEVVEEPAQVVEPVPAAAAPVEAIEVQALEPPPATMSPLEVPTPAPPQAASVAEPTISAEPVAPPPQPIPAPAAEDNIKILWNDSSGRTAPRSSSAGLFGRWLKKPSEEPAPEAPVVEEPVSEVPAAVSEADSSVMRREAAASAVDVLFDRTSGPQPASSEESIAKPKPKKRTGGRAANQARMAVTVLLGTCFSTTRSLVLSLVALVGLVIALAAIGIGAAGLTWVFLEEQPNGAYHNMTAVPQRTLQDASKNGYFMLLGFSLPTNQDPVLAGFERKVDDSDAEFARGCLAGDGGSGAVRQGASADVLGKWYRAGDPAAQMSGEPSGVKAWIGQADVSMGRYRQWLKMPFEDWGYGEGASPNCGVILYAHRLYVAEGFAQDQDAGVDRLEADLGAWRAVLGHAKTLPIKMLATSAMNDDIAVVSGLLLRPDLEERLIGRLAKMARPLDQVEQSMRWPMQSQFVQATKTIDQALKHDKGETRPFYVSVAAAMPLPKQRRFNDYAEYYEAAGKVASEGQFSHIPKRGQFVRTPADGFTDYLVNPIEHIIGLEPLPAWETYGGLVLETDARLRLAGLQAWLRRTSPEQDLLTRVAKAGQAFYDPFTGLPMLVNLKRGLFYSVGRDLKDSDASAPADVVASIPLMQGQEGKRSGKAR